MISIKNNFLFIHIPKTAGNSIQNVLKEYSEDKITISSENKQDGINQFGIRSNNYNLNKHSNLKNYKYEIERDIFTKLFKFTVVRNPWDRVISFYFSPL